jgi:phospholipid/cholesterol/gamma-HCH transport system substrate-binding protein
MKSFHERNSTVIGATGTAFLLAVLVVVLNINNIPFLSTTETYHGEFPEAAGLRAGDDVQIAGLKVGSVGAVELDGTKVVVDLDVDSDTVLGSATTAAIKVQTALGRKFVELVPSGDGRLANDSTIPLARTRSPYDLTQGLADLTTTVGQLDVGKLAQALDDTGSVLGQLPPDVKTSLDGLSRLSQTISSRDGALGELLQHANGVSGVLAERNQQISTLLVDGRSLLAALNDRRDTIHQLLVNVQDVTDELRGLVADNQKQIGPALDQLKGVFDLLNNNYANLSDAITRLGPFARQLGEAVNTGPFFEAFVQNLVPANLLPQIPLLSGGDVKLPGLGTGSDGAPIQPGTGGN